MEKEKKQSKLGKQILKFGVVGGVAFLIDFTVYTIALKFIDWEYGYLVAGFLGFSVSLIFNYLASMAFVFERKENADKRAEFIIFLILSLVGMGVNTLVLWLCVDVLYGNVGWIQAFVTWVYNVVLLIKIDLGSVADCAALGAKVVATAIVMVYNFISRKVFLEKKEDDADVAKSKEI